MSVTLSPTATNSEVQVSVPRVVSIDIFRGLTMAVMIFVNELSGVPNIPWWSEHAPGHLDYMTYVDMVFPFFLFIVGISMPLAITQRLKRNPSMLALCLHVVLRFLGLLALGLILANAEDADATKMGMSGAVWGLLSLLSAGLYLNSYPKSGWFARYSWALRAIGVFAVIVLFAIFRHTSIDGRGTWFHFGYPEILGLIAYSYLASALLYIPTRRWKWAAPTWCAATLVLNVLSSARIIGAPATWEWYYWPFSNGSMCCLIFGGIYISSLFVGEFREAKPQRGMLIAASFGILMLVLGRVFSPLGISKIRATPTWTLYSMGAAAIMFTVLYWLCDMKKQTSWAGLIKPAGSNTLTTYLLPDFWYFLTILFGFNFLGNHFPTGWPAVLKTVAFTVMILLSAAGLTKARIRLQL